MDDEQLGRTLQSVGKSCFANYFTEFSDLSLPDRALSRMLAEREGWSEVSTLHRRVRGARRIIRAGRANDALLLIADSPGVPSRVRLRALSCLGGWRLAP